jgi:tetratricopeptide (TPR) repeat protein
LAVAMIMLLMGSVPVHAAWHEAKSKHFIVYADQPQKDLRAFAERLERFDQAVRLVRKMTDPPLTDSNRLTIFVVSNQAAVERLAGGDGVVGFYAARASGSLAFVPKKAGSKYDKWDLDAEAVFFHEYGHHLQLQYADMAIPVWVSEGFAEFFAPTQLRDDGSVAIGAPPAYRAQALFMLDDLTLEEMLGARPKFTGTEFLETYGRGWLLIHYLAFNRARHGQLDRYIDDIQKGIDPLVAARSAFGDLKQLNGELYRYLRQKKLPQLILSRIQLQSGVINIRSLTPGESAIMDVHMRSRKGVSKKSARKVVADARKIAASYPGDAAVQTALAESEFDVENYPAAEAAADRALAADPKLFSALIYKGRARMELARKSQSPANWGEIRSWFLRANKVDPEAAEPLMQFYNGYLYAGARPTKNAVDGLLYSLAIAPNDNKLRIIAVRQLLNDGRIADARRYFAPLAFEPHASKVWREASVKVMAALNSSDRSVAIASLDEAEKVLKGDD